jgi:molecular chaperone GrpE (heat shock protein)
MPDESNQPHQESATKGDRLNHPDGLIAELERIKEQVNEQFDNLAKQILKQDANHIAIEEGLLSSAYDTFCDTFKHISKELTKHASEAKPMNEASEPPNEPVNQANEEESNAPESQAEPQPVANDSTSEQASDSQAIAPDPNPETPITEGVTPPMAPEGIPTETQPSAPDYNELVENKWKAEHENWQEDQKNLTKYFEEAKHWQQRSTDAKTVFASILSKRQEIIERSGELYNNFPTDIKETLAGRNDGIQLVGRMIDRLEEHAQRLGEEVTPIELEELPEPEKLLGLLVKENPGSPNEAKQLLNKQIKEISNRCFQQVTDMRNAAKDQKKRFLGFMEKRVVPVLDGIESGERNSESVINDLCRDHAEIADPLKKWLSIYAQLNEAIFDMLSEVKIQRMIIKEKEEVIDYEKHEPFDVEQNSALEDETITEVVRSGYEYHDYQQPDDKLAVLRSASVIVVKN